MAEDIRSVLYCKECGGFVEYETRIQLTSSPPKYAGKCSDCGAGYYTHCHKVVEALEQCKS